MPWKRARLALAFGLVALSGLSIAADQEKIPFLKWTAPSQGPKPGLIDGMDRDTLVRLTESASVIYFQPRSVEDRFDVVVGMMAHAPAAEVWKVVSDHMGACKYISGTFDACSTVSREGNVVLMDYKIHTSVVKFSFNMNIKDKITEDAPNGWHLETIEGELKGRELDLLLVPVDANRTMMFFRYFGSMRSMGAMVSMVLKLIPDFETPVYSAAANYHLRSYRNEVERRVGYKPPESLPPLEVEKLDAATISKIAAFQGGLIRETWEGKTIDATGFVDVAAPIEATFAVISDFEHYNEFFPDSQTEVLSRQGATVMIHQKINQMNVYIFKFVFDLTSRYQLDPPKGMTYDTVDGPYAGTKGSFKLIPHADGQRTLVYSTMSAMIEKDESLTMKIVRSGDFPFDTMANFFFMRDVLNKMSLEVERRKKK